MSGLPLPPIFRVPDEILLDIFSAIHHRPRDRQADLRNLALTCRRFLPVARDVLLQAPSVHILNVPRLARAFFKYPIYAKRVKTLECVSISLSKDIHERDKCESLNGEMRCDWMRSEAELQDQCAQFIRNQGSDFEDLWLSDLSKYCRDAYLGILLTMLPNIKELLLGPNKLKHCPVIWPHVKDCHQGCNHGKPSYWTKRGNEQVPYIMAISRALAPRLRTLELPGGWDNQTHVPFEHIDLSPFTALRHLTLPGRSSCGNPGLSLPPTLEVLIIADGMLLRKSEDGQIQWFSIGERTFNFPPAEKLPVLRAVSVYFHHGYLDASKRRLMELFGGCDFTSTDDGRSIDVHIHMPSTKTFDCLRACGQPHKYTEDELLELELEPRYTSGLDSDWPSLRSRRGGI